MGLCLGAAFADGGVGVINAATVNEFLGGVEDEDFWDDGGFEFCSFLLLRVWMDGERDLKFLHVGVHGGVGGERVGYKALEINALGCELFVALAERSEVVAGDGTTWIQQDDDVCFDLGSMAEQATGEEDEESY